MNIEIKLLNPRTSTTEFVADVYMDNKRVYCGAAKYGHSVDDAILEATKFIKIRLKTLSDMDKLAKLFEPK